MRPTLLLPALLLAPFGLAAEPAVLPEFRTTLPNGLSIVATRYPEAEGEVRMALLVPAGAAAQSTGLPGLARSVAWHRAHREPDSPIDVAVGARWAVFTTAGTAKRPVVLAERLASIWQAPPPGSRPARPLPTDGWAVSRDALYAALYPEHPLGNALLPTDDLGELVVRGLVASYTPSESYLLVVGDVDPFEIAGMVGGLFKGWPVSPRRPMDPFRGTDLERSERTVALPEGAAPTFAVGGRLRAAPEDEVGRAPLLLALEAVRARLAAAWSNDGRRGDPPRPRQLEGDVWVVGPVAGDSRRQTRAVGDTVLRVLDGVAREGLSPAEIDAARDALVQQRRAPLPGGSTEGFFRLLLGSRLGGGVPSVALEAERLAAADGEDADRLARGLFAPEARVVVFGE